MLPDAHTARLSFTADALPTAIAMNNVLLPPARMDEHRLYRNACWISYACLRAVHADSLCLLTFGTTATSAVTVVTWESPPAPDACCTCAGGRFLYREPPPYNAFSCRSLYRHGVCLTLLLSPALPPHYTVVGVTCHYTLVRLGLRRRFYRYVPPQQISYTVGDFSISALHMVHLVAISFHYHCSPPLPAAFEYCYHHSMEQVDVFWR